MSRFKGMRERGRMESGIAKSEGPKEAQRPASVGTARSQDREGGPHKLQGRVCP